MGQPVFAFVFTDTSQFVPFGSGIGSGICTPDMAMFGDGGGDVLFSGQTAPGSPLTLPVPPGGPGAKTQQVALMRASSASITVAKGKKPSFRFAVCDGSGSYQGYVLAGIALRNTAGGTGIGQFPGLSISVHNGATLLELNDDNKDSNTYEFDVLVQNAAGQVGLIDPRIVNQT